MLVKPGTVFQSCDSGKRIQIVAPATGNKHWTCRTLGRKGSHHIHEGTLQKYYEPAKPEKEADDE